MFVTENLLYNNTMRKYEFKKYIPDGIVFLGKLIQAKEYKLYIVGGYPRDIILGFSNLNGDIDVCGDCLPEDFLKVVENEERIKVGTSNFPLGTIKLIIDGILDVEYTCFRMESYRGDGHHTPNKVVFTDDVYIDASRRDFTINAIYLDPVTCELYDPFAGEKHINKKLIKTTRNSEDVFTEDALRLLRMCRFAGKLNFDIEENTLIGAKKSVHLIKSISFERIGAEMHKIICENKYAIFSFDAMYDSNINTIVCPEVSYNQAIKIVDVSSSNTVRWAVFLAEKKSKEAYEYIVGMHLGKSLAKQVKLIIGTSLFLKNLEENFIKIQLATIGYNNAQKILEFNKIQNPTFFKSLNSIISDMNKSGQFIKLEELKIDGNDIRDELNVEGKMIGNLIQEAYRYVILNPQKNNSTDLINYLKKHVKYL